MIPFVPPSCCVYDIEGNYIDLDQCQTFMLGPPGRVSGGQTNTALFYDVSAAGSPVISTRFSLVSPNTPVSNISLKLAHSILLAIRAHSHQENERAKGKKIKEKADFKENFRFRFRLV